MLRLCHFNTAISTERNEGDKAKEIKHRRVAVCSSLFPSLFSILNTHSHNTNFFFLSFFQNNFRAFTAHRLRYALPFLQYLILSSFILLSPIASSPSLSSIFSNDLSFIVSLFVKDRLAIPPRLLLSLSDISLRWEVQRRYFFFLFILFHSFLILYSYLRIRIRIRI